jgi:hypothetical protein
MSMAIIMFVAVVLHVADADSIQPSDWPGDTTLRVQGAGYKACNGYYSEAGTHEGKPMFRSHDGTTDIRWYESGQSWWLRRLDQPVPDGCGAYSTPSTTLGPDGVTEYPSTDGWRDDGTCDDSPGVPPLPTITYKWYSVGVTAVERIVTVMAALALAVTCATCIACVVSWSRDPGSTTGPILGIIVEESETILVKQVVGFVMIRLAWSFGTLVAFTIAQTVSGQPGDQHATDYVALTGWVIGLPAAFCIPACGYCGAKERHRWTLGIFVAGNMLVAIETVGTVIVSLSVYTGDDAETIETTSVYYMMFQAISVPVSIVNAVAGYRLWEHWSTRHALGTALMQPAATPFPSVITPSQPSVRSGSSINDTGVNCDSAPMQPSMQGGAVDASVEVSTAAKLPQDEANVKETASPTSEPQPELLPELHCGVAATTTAAAAAAAAAATMGSAIWKVHQLSQWRAEDMRLSSLSVAATQQQIDGPVAAEMGTEAWRELGATAIEAAKLVAAFKRGGMGSE